ncbi:MAG TPA: hypothetical protein VFM06_10220 [Candidatus Limnocylindria bacterium]|nr:hypothetical protein [Candidatus Limnocylindria bacterium]
MRVAPLALVLGTAFGALVSLQPVSDSDLFWHVATGARTLGGDLPRTDRFSWTIAGAPVLTDQWLGDALFALARALGDWRGVLALRVVAVAALVAIVVDSAVRARPGRPVVAAAAALPAIALSRFAWTDRPELLGLVCFAVLVRLLRGGDRELLLTLPLLALWAQLHGSYALGLGLVLASCAARALAEQRERWRFVPIAAAAVSATLIGPSGLASWTSSGGHFLAPPRYISEEGVPDPSTLPGLLFVAALALVLATALRSPRRATLRDLALLLPVAFVALTAARHTPLFAIAAVPYLAERWPDPLARWRAASDGHDRATEEGEVSGRATGHDRATEEGAVSGRATETLSTARTPSLGRDGVPRAAGALGRAAAVGACGVVLCVSVALASGRVDESGYPRGALAALPAGPGLLNQYDWGGYLIEFAPRAPVFIDGRLFPFVPAVLEDYRAIVGARPGWEAVAERRGVRAILVRPADPIAVRAPDRGWRVAYADAVAVLLVR